MEDQITRVSMEILSQLFVLNPIVSKEHNAAYATKSSAMMELSCAVILALILKSKLLVFAFHRARPWSA